MKSVLYRGGQLSLSLGGLISLYLSIRFFGEFRQYLPFIAGTPYHWLLLSVLFGFLTGFCIGTTLFVSDRRGRLQFDWLTFVSHALPAILLVVTTLLIAYQLGLQFEDIFFLNVSPMTGPGALVITVQPIIGSIWIGIAVGKAISLQ